MKQLLFIILLNIPFFGIGQGWEKTFGGTGDDYGYSVQQTTDGGYIITGTTESFGNGGSDVYLIKTDVNGDSLWTKTFGGIDSDRGHSIQQTTDGGYIITGSTTSFGNGGFDVYLIKTDGSGNEQWTKTFGGTNGDEGFSVQQTTGGGYIITGYTVSFLGSRDVYLIKTDGNGDSLWTKTFGGTDHTVGGRSVQQTTDGGFIITGHKNFIVYLMKTDGNGDSLWTKTFGGIGDWGFSVQQTTDGGYIITGNITSFGNGGSDVYLIKTDGNGDSLWTKTFGGTDHTVGGRSVQQTTDGGFIITGHKNFIVYLMKTDGNGDSLWTKTFGGIGDWGFSVQQTTDGGYIITGDTESFGNGYKDVYLIKTDGNGNITSTFEIPISSNRKLENVVDILGRETKSQPNTPFIEIYDDGSTEKKLIIEK